MYMVEYQGKSYIGHVYQQGDVMYFKSVEMNEAVPLMCVKVLEEIYKRR